jgi:hypothetical protein
MATSFSGGGSRSTRREPPTLHKQLINFITCGCESSVPFFVNYKAGRESEGRQCKGQHFEDTKGVLRTVNRRRADNTKAKRKRTRISTENLKTSLSSTSYFLLELYSQRMQIVRMILYVQNVYMFYIILVKEHVLCIDCCLVVIMNCSYYL